MTNYDAEGVVPIETTGVTDLGNVRNVWRKVVFIEVEEIIECILLLSLYDNGIFQGSKTHLFLVPHPIPFKIYLKTLF